MTLWTAALVLAAATPAPAQRQAGDPSAPKFYLSGQFQEAVKRSEELGRMLLVKGVSVIMSEPATKSVREGTC